MKKLLAVLMGTAMVVSAVSGLAACGGGGSKGGNKAVRRDDPRDQEAFELFQKYAALAEEGKRRYEAMYGPLTQRAAAMDASYQWLNDPWPWEYDQKGAGK